MARILCWLGQHDWAWDAETVRLRGDIKVSIRECRHCGTRRGTVDHAMRDR